MRLYYKKQYLTALERLSEVQTEIVNLIEKKQSQEAADILEQCQQEAIRIGTAVEESEGEGTEAVHSLEQYCELIYQLYEEVLQGATVNGRQRVKKLQKLLQKAESSLRHEIRTQKEAVFLPYKASMWDSLESVWKVANEDPDCNAVVVPIPYYDKNPDGTFREMHYEIDQFPADVPVVHYTVYDFGKNHPDKIFIHNPYDDGNYVTSVHPFFFSENLKRYTDELIYIPYFILNEIDPSNEEAVKGMEHFCMTAGVVNADRVIVQSEAMKQIYVNVLSKYLGEEKRPYWQEKILGLGSPKVDRVCNPRSEDLELPEEWERLVQTEAGARKKIIFYNTSVSALLHHGEDMLAKMEEVFRVFEEHRDTVTLLWRPHPLIEATLTSMRPALWETYEGMVQKYQAAGWGIYDDSANMNRAIAVSDGYYGDWSSIVWLYQKTGKPIMIQDCAVREGTH
ncbi:MAG: hypothetical protein HFI67_06975 [Lachnospiraceae bacterium]|jgi:hypothetical protein|nr:hypothetical protein [Lachnospiraceae bacterium]